MPELAEGPCSEVCVLSFDGEPADFYRSKTRTARKRHACCECHEPILRGQPYEHVSGKWEDHVGSYKTCVLCIEIRGKFSCGGWVFTVMWETLREGLFPDLTFGCLEGLSVAAREKVLAAWRKWKGLTE
jgi:hypothetical protein